MELKIKTYHPNAIIASERDVLNVYYDGDSLAWYSDENYDSREEALEEYEADLREQITDKFGNDVENLDNIVRSILIYAENYFS